MIFKFLIKFFRMKRKKIIVGIDEAGRGPLAGPVVAVAITLNPKFEFRKIKNHPSFLFLLKNVKDSKKISPKKREKIYQKVLKSPFFVFGVGKVSERVIDKINIFKATKLAMERSVKNLEKKLNLKNKKKVLILLDGGFKINSDHSQISIVKGDQKNFLISLASILAKVYRDRLMKNFAKKFPNYGFEKHKGYATKNHLKALKKYGPCKIHRLSFSLVRKFL
jgi:ribonuclease HII